MCWNWEEDQCSRHYFNFRVLFRLAQKSIQSGLSKSEKSLAKRNATFRKTLVLVFVNENCCFCKWFTELYLFYWLFVASLAILIALQFVFSRSWTSLAGIPQMLRASICLPVSRRFCKTPFKDKRQKKKKQGGRQNLARRCSRYFLTEFAAKSSGTAETILKW